MATCNQSGIGGERQGGPYWGSTEVGQGKQHAYAAIPSCWRAAVASVRSTHGSHGHVTSCPHECLLSACPWQMP